jgi:hypothetical protein
MGGKGSQGPGQRREWQEQGCVGLPGSVASLPPSRAAQVALLPGAGQEGGAQLVQLQWQESPVQPAGGFPKFSPTGPMLFVLPLFPLLAMSDADQKFILPLALCLPTKGKIQPWTPSPGWSLGCAFLKAQCSSSSRPLLVANDRKARHSGLHL